MEIVADIKECAEGLRPRHLTLSVPEQARANGEHPKNIKGGEDAQGAPAIEAFQGDRTSFLLFLQQEPGNQEAAEDKKSEHAKRAREKRKSPFISQVIEEHEKNCDSANSVQSRDRGKGEPGLKLRIGALSRRVRCGWVHHIVALSLAM